MLKFTPVSYILHSMVLCRQNFDLTEATQTMKLSYLVTNLTKSQISNHLYDCKSICSYFWWC